MSNGAAAAVAALAADLASAIAGRPLRITTGGAVGREAADYWAAGLRDAGVTVVDPREETDRAVRIHLHDEPGAANSYSATGLEPAAVGADLVGEVVGAGASSAERLASLMTVADALVAALHDIDQLEERT